jgi:hypothetical protein
VIIPVTGHACEKKMVVLSLSSLLHIPPFPE